MLSPSDILVLAFEKASSQLNRSIINEPEMLRMVEDVCRNIQNRAAVRLLLACLLAKVHKNYVDIRKPYTQIGDADCYSGRTYDETYITSFINEHELPCNPTTAFLTPALRNRNIVLTPDVNLVGRPPKLYQQVLQLLNDVYENRIPASDLLAETIRFLLIVRNEKRQRMQTLLVGLQSSKEATALSTEAIINLIDQHMKCRGSSRLPVLIVAAAYQAASEFLMERVLPLQLHNAADEQTGALGDLEIILIGEDRVITSYEMKTRKVTIDDINRALQKINERIQKTGEKIDNYIFITTDSIDNLVEEYAATIYERTGGIEVAILDCLSFIRHFLHLFHRLRMQFLEAYQNLVLAEPDSAVSQPLKEAFLVLRQAAETGE